MRELKCRELGNDCDWGVIGENDAEILSKAQEHAKVIHGRVQVYEDIETGLQSKIRDVKSPRSNPVEDRLS